MIVLIVVAVLLVCMCLIRFARKKSKMNTAIGTDIILVSLVGVMSFLSFVSGREFFMNIAVVLASISLLVSVFLLRTAHE